MEAISCSTFADHRKMNEKLLSFAFIRTRVISILFAVTIIISATYVASKSSCWETQDLWASQFRYIAIKKTIHLGRPQHEESFEIKANICTGIIRSEYLDRLFYLNPVDLNSEVVREELRENYSSIYVAYVYAQPSTDQVKFVNPYRLRQICVVDDAKLDHDPSKTFELSEWVFGCLARHRNFGKIVEYFISQQYEIDQSVPRWPTRLVFGPDLELGYNENKTIIPIAEAWIPPPGDSYRELYGYTKE